MKSVSLDEQTAAIADNIGNFSKFVRGRLIEYDNTTKATAIQILEHNAPRTIRANGNLSVAVCFPFHLSGCCILCWPDGPPTRGAWLEWTATIKTGTIHAPKPRGEGWHDGKIQLEANPPKARSITEKKTKKAPSRGFWARLWFKES